MCLPGFSKIVIVTFTLVQNLARPIIRTYYSRCYKTLTSVYFRLSFFIVLFPFYFQADGTCAGVQCSEHAQCVYAADNERKCVCNDGYQGDGQTCARKKVCLKTFGMHFLVSSIERRGVTSRYHGTKISGSQQ